VPRPRTVSAHGSTWTCLEPVVGGSAFYPRKLLKDLLHFFREYSAKAPDTVTSTAAVVIGPESSPLAGQSAGWAGVCHFGPESDGERLVRPIKEFGPPAMDFSGPMSYQALQTIFDAGSPAGQRN
jgi:hypothetical protein